MTHTHEVVNSSMSRSSGPLVSVIMPFLNAERFIREAIESVLAQTYDNWELLLVDDGSTDRSSDIAKDYARRFQAKIKYLKHIRHQNRGTSASRNLGIRHAHGEYIAFLDSDDAYFPHKLEHQISLLNSHPNVALVCGRSETSHSWSGNREDTNREVIQQLDVPLDTIVKPPTMLLLYLRDEAANPTDTMVRREAVDAVGGWEETFKQLHDDQAFYAKLCLRYNVFVSSTCSYRYRKHPASMCQVALAAGQHPAARQRFLNWLKRYLSEKEIRHQELWRVLQAERRQAWRLCHPKLTRIQRELLGSRGILRRVGRWILPLRLRAWLRT
jgi:glycosyltransferase involved in cell wall biosynthesis